MPVGVKERPTAVEPNTSEVSYWGAAYNYTRFKFQRQDRVFATVTNISGDARFNFGSAPPSGIEIGTRIYVQSANGTTYNAEGEVTAISGNNITTNIPYVSSTSGFAIYPTLIINWKCEVIVDKWNGSSYIPISGQMTTDDTPMVRFNNLPNGDIIAEIQTYLQSCLNNDYSYTPTGLNFIDSNNFVQYRVRYRENYYGLTPDLSDYLVVADPTGTPDLDFWGINAARQNGESLAPNMAQYLMIDDGACDGLFLSGFDEPTWFLGYPFGLSFLYHEDGGALNLLQRWYDINKVQVDSVGQGAITDHSGKISTLGVNRGTQTSLDYEFTSLTLQTSGGLFPAVSEAKMIRKREACDGVYLTWKNKFGGWDYWLFTQRQIVSKTAKNGVVFEPYIEDMSTDNNKQKVLTKASQSVLTLAASNLDSNDLNGLLGLATSIAVYALDINGNVLYRAIIQDGTWPEYDTQKPLQELVFNIIKPADNIQSE